MIFGQMLDWAVVSRSRLIGSTESIITYITFAQRAFAAFWAISEAKGVMRGLKSQLIYD
jgi:hypothetical protein